MIVIEWVFNIAFLVFLLSVPVGVVLRLVELVLDIKCFRKMSCSNRDYRFRAFCRKYRELPTQEDIDELKEMLEERRRELAMEDTD